MHNTSVNFIWDEPTRLANLAKQGLDFADAVKVFAGPMVLFEDDRFDYREQRMIGVGLLDDLVVLIVPVQSDDTIRSESFQCERQKGMKQTSTTKTLVTSEDEAPALSQGNFDGARFRIGKHAASRSERQTAVRGRIAKQHEYHA
jgi:uncharacterized DUF497 family protein